MEINPPRPDSSYFTPDTLVQPVFFAVPKSKRRWRRSAGVLLTLSVMAGAGSVLYFQIIGQQGRFIQSIDLKVQPEPQIPTDTGPEVPLRARENLPQLTEDTTNDIAAVPETKVANESRSSRKAVETNPKQNPGGTGEKSNDPNQPDNYAIGAHKLQIEIYQAIHHRGISGVQVSVSDGTVYLDGRVVTPRQKLAAVRATLSVPGVKRVQNGIIVTG